MYNFRIDEMVKWIKERNIRNVCLQMPEGLKIHAQAISEEIEKNTGAATFILADPCYGACDVASGFFDHVDGLIHIGHSEIPTLAQDSRILYVEIEAALQDVKYPEGLLTRLGNRIGLITTVPYLGELDRIKKWLESNGKEVFIGRQGPRTLHPGQILGCDISSACSISNLVDHFLYIGSGDFHPLAVAIETKKEVVIYDPASQEIRDLGDLSDRVMRQRHGAIVKASKGKKFLILVSLKPGQKRIALAMELKKLALKYGRSANIILMNEFNPDYLITFEADAYVSTACPRIAIDDLLRYPKPILTPVEFEIALGNKSWDDYHLDFML